MNISEATIVAQKLLCYTSKTMMPFNAPVRNFIILPSGQKEFDSMFREITSNRLSLTTALEKYKNDVTVVVYFDSLNGKAAGQHCNFKYFLHVNNIDLDQ